MATFKAIVFSSTNHVKNDGTSNIKIRVYHNEDSQYLPTQFYIPPEYLLKSGDVSQDWPEADMLNFEIGEIIQKYRRNALKLGSSKLAQMTCKDLKKYLQIVSEPDGESIDFVTFSKAVISETTKKKTAAWYDVAVNAICWFYGKEIIDVKEITSSKLNQFKKRLQESGIREKPLEPGSINNYLRALRSLFNKCKLHYNDDDLGLIRIPHDPFARLDIPEYTRKRKNIGIDEMKKIRDSSYETERENIGRDVFIMLFYLMGINATDLFNLQPPVDGRIQYERSKTNTTGNKHGFVLSIRIEPELQRLFEKYSQDGFLSVLKSRYADSYAMIKAVNQGLKKISEKHEISKVTTNWARHTWASLARNKAGVSKADIDFCLGHVSNDHKMADIYIDIDYSIFDKNNRLVLDLILDKKPDEKKSTKNHLRVAYLKNTV